MNLVIVGDCVAQVWVSGLGGADPEVRSWPASCMDAKSSELAEHEVPNCLGLEVSATGSQKWGRLS